MNRTATTDRRVTASAAAVLAAVVLAMSGCASADLGIEAADGTDRSGAAEDGAAPQPGTAASTGADPTSAPATSGAAVADAATHAVAVVAGSIAVHHRPDRTSAATELAATTSLGADRTLRVLEATPDGEWLRVRVPSRPNNADGWVVTEDVTLRAVRHHIAIDLSERTLVLREDGEPVLTTTIAVGTAENPTPTGTFFVTDKLATDPDGAYGPHAIGIAAWSETLSEFAGGDGQIGLHGTDQPQLLGKAVSHGCVRMSNEAVTELASVLPLGVPVDIEP